MKTHRQRNGGAEPGLIGNLTADPCMAHATNRHPLFFPLAGRYPDCTWYEADPRDRSTWAQVKTYLATLRGHSRPVP